MRGWLLRTGSARACAPITLRARAKASPARPACSRRSPTAPPRPDRVRPSRSHEPRYLGSEPVQPFVLLPECREGVGALQLADPWDFGALCRSEAAAQVERARRGQRTERPPRRAPRGRLVLNVLVGVSQRERQSARGRRRRCSTKRPRASIQEARPLWARVTPDGARLEDDPGAVAAPTAVLIRPNGHVAWSGTARARVFATP